MAHKDMLAQKLAQAQEILREKGLDLWLIFVRESALMPDPSLEMVVGTHVTWQSAFLIPARGETVALVGSLDAHNMREKSAFDRVEGYVEGIRGPLMEHLTRLDPAKIAINYSRDSETADGLTHGMYLNLVDLVGPYAERLVSSEELLSALRGRKSPAEIDLMRAAIREALEIFEAVRGFARPGVSEEEVAGFMLARVRDKGLELAWDEAHCPAVFTGPDTAGAHASPTGRTIMPGHVMNIDFGVKVGGYCSDLQRTYYFLREGETTVPEPVLRGMETIVQAITRAAEALRPGVMGHEVDAVARGHIVAAGYDEYPHALGHQIGRQAHDGAGLLCPEWERYGRRPYQRVEAGQVYTIEPRLTVEGYGVVTIEEMVQVGDDGCTFLGPRQTEIWVV